MRGKTKETEKKMKKKKKTGKGAAICILCISAAVFVFAAVQLILYYRGSGSEHAMHDRLREIHDLSQEDKEGAYGAQGEQSEGMAGVTSGSGRDAGTAKEQLLQINEDYRAWLEIADTKISYPVVKRDNVFYLTHDFEQERSSRGTLFLDEACVEDSAVWLVHGHHMKDGTMFGGLKRFEKKAYIEDHRQLYLDVGAGNEPYRIFAAALIDFSQETEESKAFHYEQTPQEGRLDGAYDAEFAADFEAYCREIRLNAYWYDESVEQELEEAAKHPEERKLVVLSTCEYGTQLQRLIIVAVKEG